MVVGDASVFHGQIPQDFGLLGHFPLGQHTDVGADPEGLLAGHSVTVEGAAVPQDEVASQRVHLQAVREGLALLILLRYQKPVLLEIEHGLLLEVLPVVAVRARQHHEATLVLTRVGKCLYALVAPDQVPGGGLVAVEEGVDGGLLVVADAVHEAEAVEGALQVLAVPQALEKRHGALAELPLRARVPHVLDHPPVQHGRVVLAQHLRLRLVAVQRPVRQHLHDCPEILHVLRALLTGQPARNHHEALLIQVPTPPLLILKRKTIALISLHANQKKNYTQKSQLDKSLLAFQISVDTEIAAAGIVLLMGCDCLR